jgi:hypothetical protein
MSLLTRIDQVNKDIKEKEAEILQARKKLKSNPGDADAQVEVDYFQEQLQELKATRKELYQKQELSLKELVLLQARKRLQKNPDDVDAQVEFQFFSEKLSTFAGQAISETPISVSRPNPPFNA